MLSTLVDNSTLTSVQRMIGDVPVALSFPIEGDLSAYDNYLQALLIYDEIAALDDYKEEFRSDRRKRFKEVRFLGTDNLPYDEISRISAEAASGIHFKISRGRLAHDPMAEFLRSLNLHVSPAWYMQSSDWFLRLRLLAEKAEIDLPKYGALMSAIRTQSSEFDRSTADHNSSFTIEDSSGIELDTSASGDRSIDGDIRRFAASLNWLAERALFYAEAAQRFESAFTLHPIRHNFFAQYALAHLTPLLTPNLRAKALEFFERESAELRNQSDELIGGGIAGLRLPFFAAWAVGHAGNPKDGYDHVLQIRNGAEARSLRSRFREIEATSEEGDFLKARKSVARLHQAIAEDLKNLKSKFGATPTVRSLDFGIDLLTLSPSISVSASARKLTTLIPRGQPRASSVLRSISRDVLNAPTMGEISDRFHRSRKIRKNSGFNPERPRMEPKQFERSKTHWKEPL